MGTISEIYSCCSEIVMLASKSVPAVWTLVLLISFCCMLDESLGNLVVYEFGILVWFSFPDTVLS